MQSEIEEYISNGYKLEQRIDLAVTRYFGTFVPESVSRILKRFPVDNDEDCDKAVIPKVWINLNDNSDIFDLLQPDENDGDSIPRNTFKVEISTKFGVFGQSSPFCRTIQGAMDEAVLDLLYKLLIMPKGIPNLVCYRSRLT